MAGLLQGQGNFNCGNGFGEWFWRNFVAMVLAEFCGNGFNLRTLVLVVCNEDYVCDEDIFYVLSFMY